MRDTDFTYAVAYIKTLENKMLTRSDFEQLAQSDFDSALGFLEKRGYDTSLPVDEMLTKQDEWAWEETLSVCPSGSGAEVLKYENDFHNLKAVLKAAVSGRPWERLVLRPFTVEPELIEKAVLSADFSQLPEFMRGAAKDAYEAVAQTHDGQRAEIIVDKAYFETALKSCGDNELLKGYVRLSADMVNISASVRCARQKRSAAFIEDVLVAGGELDRGQLARAAAAGEESALSEIGRKYPELAEAGRVSVTRMEKDARDKLVRYIKRAKMQNFGKEPIAAFLQAKRMELRNLRIVLYGLKNKTDKEIILERLGDSYA